nr:uncharacterized protein LOC109187484 [Ipomoea trifida]
MSVPAQNFVNAFMRRPNASEKQRGESQSSEGSSNQQKLLDDDNSGTQSVNSKVSGKGGGRFLVVCGDLLMILSCCYCCFCCGVTARLEADEDGEFTDLAKQ